MSEGFADAPSRDLQGIERIRTLWRLWRSDRTDPRPFYRVLAREAAQDLERRGGVLSGSTIVDLAAARGSTPRRFERPGPR